MEKGTFYKDHSEDFTSIGIKIQSGENLNDVEKSSIFSIGLNFTQRLVDSKKNVIYGYDTQPQAVKDYFVGAILGRIISLHRSALKEGLKASESITIFKDLKDVFCDKLSIEAQILPDEKLNTIFEEGVDIYLDEKINDEVKNGFSFIRKTLTTFVAENPSVQVERERYPLD